MASSDGLFNSKKLHSIRIQTSGFGTRTTRSRSTEPDVLAQHSGKIALSNGFGPQLAACEPAGEAQPVGEQDADADDDVPDTRIAD